MRQLVLFLLLCIVGLPNSFASPEGGERGEGTITLLATTSVENSGFLDYILPHFEKAHGISVRAVISGSGAAMQSGMRGNGDVLITHSPMDEAQFIADGWGVKRLPFMFNEFVIIGDIADEALVGGAKSVEDAFQRIANLGGGSGGGFVSRDDGSGTDRREKMIWDSIGIDTVGSQFSWYLETGGGMGSAFSVAISKGAYIFGDSSTWARFGRKGDHKILFRDTENLRNQYVLMAVNSARHEHVKSHAVQIFIDWILSAEGQKLIDEYKINGVNVFTANGARHMN